MSLDVEGVVDRGVGGEEVLGCLGFDQLLLSLFSPDRLIAEYNRAGACCAATCRTTASDSKRSLTTSAFGFGRARRFRYCSPTQIIASLI